MFGLPTPSALALALIAVLAGSARINRDVILDTLSPVANAILISPPSLPPVPASESIAHDVSRGADGLFYVNALINDRPVRFLVDTGASVVVLTAADARHAGVVVDPAGYDGSVATVGGSTAMAWATLDKVNLAGHEVRGLKVAVVRNGLGVSLLGQNMLSQLHSVTLSADRLSLR